MQLEVEVMEIVLCLSSVGLEVPEVPGGPVVLLELGGLLVLVQGG